MRLNEIKDNKGANKSRMRVGRGIGSGKGKTSGRGVKGQKARTGVSINGYEGGQMPIFRRMPKRGFNSLNPTSFQVLNLDDLQQFVDSKKIDPKKTLTAASLKEAGVIKSIRDGVKILGSGELKTALTLEVAGASKSAIAAVEKAGGKLMVIAKKPEVPKGQKLAKKAPTAKKSASE
jgi:large subunit ribosomal protein L15